MKLTFNKKLILGALSLCILLGMTSCNLLTGKKEKKVEHPWVQLWEGGPKWATYNVGAKEPWEFGGSCCWGAIKEEGNDCYEGNSTLPKEKDFATQSWGESWRMPTKDEYQTLIKKCSHEWVKNYHASNIGGVLFKGIGEEYASNELFFPTEVNQGCGMFASIDFAFSSYWSSSPCSSNSEKAWYLDVYFNRDSYVKSTLEIVNCERKESHYVRAVLVE